MKTETLKIIFPTIVADGEKEKETLENKINLMTGVTE